MYATVKPGPSNAMAAIYLRGRTWWIRYTTGGVQRRESLGRATEAEAKTALAAKEYELRTGNPLARATAAAPRFDLFAGDYLAWYEHEYPASYRRARDIVNDVLVPEFGHLLLDEIKVKHAEDWKIRCSKALSRRVKKGAGPTRLKPETVNKYLRQLRAMLHKAVEWELLPVFPWPKKAVRQLRKEKAPPKFYSAAELNKIYFAAGPKRWWWQLFANTGMRRAEGRHLRWADISDDELNILSLEDERTKSGEYRTVPLNDKAREALDQIRQQHGRLLAGDRHSQAAYPWHDDYVLPRIHPDSLGRAFARDAARAGIGGNIHRLRHTFGTHLALKKVPPKIIQELMGHASITTTEGYLWSARENERSAVASIAL